MKKTLTLIALLGCFTSGAHAADDPPQACAQIRERIKSVTGVVSTPNMELLQQISMRQDCKFSSAEVYRAAYGDKPLPQRAHQVHLDEQEQDDD